MTQINEYLKRKFDNAYALYKEESEESSIGRILEDETEKEEFVSKRINKHTIEISIMNEYLCWEKVPEGFEFKSNYHFNEDGELEFDTSRILKTEDGYVSDGTDLSDAFMAQESSQKMLENLTSIYRSFEKMKKENSSKLTNQEQNNYMMSRHTEPHQKMFAQARISHLLKYLNTYGQKGKELLIKYLNLLSNPQKTIEEIHMDFLYDISKADEYFDTVMDSKNNNFRFESVLLEELETYSARGRKLKEHFYRAERKATEIK